jgi:hypothetical protein
MDEWLRKGQIIVDEDYGSLVASPESDGEQQQVESVPQHQTEPPPQQQ